jgi:hypothetical protein
MKLFNIKNIPLTIVVGFNLFTLILFYTAPIKWATNNLLLFFFFSITCQLMIMFGYTRGFKKSLRTKLRSTTLSSFSVSKINFVFYFYSLTFLIKYAYYLKFNVLDIGGMFSYLMIGIADPELGYNLAIYDTRAFTIPWSVYFLISIVNQVVFIIGIINWKRLNGIKKTVFIFFVIVEVFFWMGQGTNFGVIRLITTAAFCSIYWLKSINLNFKNSLRYSFVILLLLSLSIYVFSYNMNSRSGNIKLDFQTFNLGASKVNEESAILEIMPQGFQQTYMFMISYITQGYYHTCLAFDLDFKSTYFLGNNPAIISLAEIFDINVWKDTYMYRLQTKGVDPLIKWHSAYMWYASDISFFGVPFLMYFLGYIFGFSWALTLRKYDFLSNILFVIIGNMLLFLFANNSYLSSVFYSFMFILPFWYFTRVKKI